MSEPTLVRGVLLTHGAMASGMVDAVRSIAGTEEEALVALSNEGKGPDAIKQELEGILEKGPTVVFTDLQTGSCALVARLTCGRPGGPPVLFGVNLPMLLDFVFHRDMPVDELVVRLLDKGRSGVQSFGGEPHADPAVPD